MPPTLHFERPNPEIDFGASPFFVADRLIDWTTGTAPGVPRRASSALSAIGGTNAHVVLEEAPPTPAPRRRSRPCSCWRSRRAARRPSTRRPRELAAHLAGASRSCRSGRRRAHPAVRSRRLRLPALARVPRDGRRCGGAARSGARPRRHQHDRRAARRSRSSSRARAPSTPGWARRSTRASRSFRAVVDDCLARLSRAGVDLRPVLVSRRDAQARPPRRAYADRVRAAGPVRRSSTRSRGCGCRGASSRSAMLGHSIGEYVAACLAGVFTLDEALAARGRARPPDAGAPRWRHAAVPLGAERRARRSPGGAFARGGERAGAVVVAGPKATSTRSSGSLARARRRVPPPAHLARVPLLDGGPGARGVPRGRGACAPAGTVAPVRVERQRPVDHRRRGDRSRLLGAAPAPDGPVRRRRAVPARVGSRPPARGRAGPDARLARARGRR